MIGLLACLAWAADPPSEGTPGGREAAEALEADGAWGEALAAWTSCAATGGAAERRYCAARVETLRPQAEDSFAGWGVLEAVRRGYRGLGSDESVRRIEGALAANPDGPAASELRVWLVNEYRRRGDEPRLAAAREALARDPAASEVSRAWSAGGAEREAQEARDKLVATGGAAVAAVYALTAARGPGPWSWRSGAVATLLLGGFPTVAAVLYDEGYGVGFVRTGLVLGLAIAASGRAPAWIGVPGTLGALLAVVWWNGWFGGVFR